MSRSRRGVLLAAAWLSLASASCGSGSSGRAEPSGLRDVTVFAASSLSGAFTEIGDAFMLEHPDSTVTFNFSGSSELVTQINEGAPADVFASADLSTMTDLTDGGNNGSAPVLFAKNRAQIIVAPGNPRGITAVADLAAEDLIVVVCSPEVPCGKYATAIFENAAVTVTPKSLEANVKAVATKVTLGEADAGIVYRTDVIAAGAKGQGVEIPAAINVVADYPIVVVEGASNAEGAQIFIDFVTSEPGQMILDGYGFLRP